MNEIEEEEEEGKMSLSLVLVVCWLLEMCDVCERVL